MHNVSEEGIEAFDECSLCEMPISSATYSQGTFSRDELINRLRGRAASTSPLEQGKWLDPLKQLHTKEALKQMKEIDISFYIRLSDT